MPPASTTAEPPALQLAQILSDLVSLRVCPPTAATALVHAHLSSNTPSTSTSDDADLTRARDLVSLHYDVKQAHQRGELKRGLEEARRGVERAVGE